MERRELHVDVMELEIDDFDQFLGWTGRQSMVLTSIARRGSSPFHRRVTNPFVFVGSMFISRVPRISTLKAKELLNHSSIGYLAYVTDVDRPEVVGPGKKHVLCVYTLMYFVKICHGYHQREGSSSLSIWYRDRNLCRKHRIA